MDRSTKPKKSNRKSLSKKLRFEVFKRDSFKCQYCGLSAPDVVLHVDHINPIAKGGGKEITNLITSCASCNLGKGARPLDDRSVVEKQRAQLEELQERREQLAMMFEWQRGLLDIEGETLKGILDYWSMLAPGRFANEIGRQEVRKWAFKFPLTLVLESMRTAAARYLVKDKDGNCTGDSWSLALSKVPGICHVSMEVAADPSVRELYYISGSLRRRLNNSPKYGLMDEMKAAVARGVSLAEIRDAANSCYSWAGFRNAIGG